LEWTPNHVHESPAKYKRRKQGLTYNYDALIKKTQCAIDTDIFKTTMPEVLAEQCFRKTYFQDIARLVAPVSRETFRKIALRGLPVIITGYEQDNKMWQWDIDMLARPLPNGVGDCEMSVRHGNYDSLASRHFTKMNVSTFVDIVRGRAPRPPGLPPYLGNNQLSPTLKEALGYTPPMWYNKDQYSTPSLWVGAAGTESPLHKDVSSCFFFVWGG
jgi:hypothetical protein